MAQSIAASPEADAQPRDANFWPLALGTIGVTFGEIGTSPLYALREAVKSAQSHGVGGEDAVLGVLSLTLWTLLLLVTPPLAALETVDGVRTLRSADVQQVDYPTVQAVHAMGQSLHRQSGGKLAIQVYSAALLGDEATLLQLTRSGELDLNRVSAQALEDVFPLIRVLSLPFLVRDVDHLNRVLDGPIGAELLEAMNGKGLVALAFFEAGGRSICTVSHPVRRPEDLKGLRIRVPPSALASAVFEAWGARPIKLPFSQTGNALATHLIDAAENNLLAYASAEHHRHAPWLTLTHHTFSPEVLVMSRPSWDALSGAEQAMLRRAAREARPRMRDLWQPRAERG